MKKNLEVEVRCLGRHVWSYTVSIPENILFILEELVEPLVELRPNKERAQPGAGVGSKIQAE